MAGWSNQALAMSMDIPFLLGTPSDDEMLRHAGIERARSVLACVDSDAENIFICLTVRELAESVPAATRIPIPPRIKARKRPPLWRRLVVALTRRAA